MAWTLPHAHELSPVTRGIARQWAVQLGAPLPALGWLLGACPRWLAALVRARAFAVGDAEAALELDAIEHELATVTGVAPSRWPTRLRACPPARTAPELPALDPAHFLLLCGRQAGSSPRTRAAVEQLLLAAFGGYESQWSAEMRARLCTVAIPEPLQPRWRAGLGLSPPDAVAPGVHQGGIRMLAAVLGGDEVRPVGEEVFAPLSAGAAIDLLMTALVIRAALRCAGDLPRVRVPDVCSDETVLFRRPQPELVLAA